MENLFYSKPFPGSERKLNMRWLKRQYNSLKQMRIRKGYLSRFSVSGVLFFLFLSFLSQGNKIFETPELLILPLSTGFFGGLLIGILLYLIETKNRESEEFFVNLIELLAVSLDERDNYTHGHSRRVTTLALQLATRIRMPLSEIRQLRLSAILHDIGKIGIPDNLLLKPATLNGLEYEEIQRHPNKGARILTRLRDRRMSPIIDSIQHHHEKFDGTGYPNQLKGDEIPLHARIISIADAYDAMTSDRPYRKGMSTEEALKEIKQGIDSQFDPCLASEFIDMINENSIKQKCPHLENCIIIKKIEEGEIVRAFKMQYCKASFKACERYIFGSLGKKIPSDMLPDGYKIE